MTSKESGLGSFRRAARKGARLTLAAGIVFLPLALTGTAPAQTFSVVYNFGSQSLDADGPHGNLIADSAGNFYGETESGGEFGRGAIYELPAGGGETVLYSFTGVSDGAEPFGGLLRDGGGNLLGTTLAGGKFGGVCGSGGCGVVFRLSLEGTLKVLHTFSGGQDGSNPQAPLVTDGANLYGTTAFGGLVGGCGGFGCGVVFKISLQGRETILHTFTGVPDGYGPVAPLTRDSQGNLYGSTAAGGGCTLRPLGCGAIFKIDSAGNETILYSFQGGSDGLSPTTGLVGDSAGNFYGTTVEGGDFNGSFCFQAGCGVVFELDVNGTERPLYAFTGDSDGWVPQTALVRDTQGNLYGSTDAGGDFNQPCPSTGCGILFKLSPAGKLDVLHTFAYLDGWQPSSTLLAHEGYLYGTTGAGGSDGEGVVFKLQP